MPSIYLLRHCKYDNPRNILPGRLPVQLSEEGAADARELKKYFEDKNIARIYSSVVERCKQTVEAVSGGKIPITFDQRLLETFSPYQGYWGENWHGDGYHFYSHRAELGGESLADIQKRVASLWDEVTKDLAENIIICSHGDPLHTLYAYIQNLPLASEAAQEGSMEGWMEKGQFIKVTLESGKVVETEPPTSV